MERLVVGLTFADTASGRIEMIDVVALGAGQP
jgi:hypothetical protein